MFKEIEVSKLIEAEWNYKHDLNNNEILKEKMLKLESNIKRNGFIENIIVRELSNNKYEVINGNHRLLVARKLEIKEIMCYSMGEISLSQAKRIAIETNETKFEADKIRLAELIDDISKDFDDILDTTFFDKNDFELFDRIVNPESIDTSEPENKQEKEDVEEFRTIKLRLPADVADQFDEQVDRFKKLLYPNDPEKNVSIIMPIEAMIQALHQIDNNNIM
jgi:hypothetical protein